jgi:hypothetical protein
LLNFINILAEADSYAIQKEAALRRQAEGLRRRLKDIMENIDPNQFLKTLSVADQTMHRPKVEPSGLGHPRFYWILKNVDYVQWLAEDSEKVLLLSGPTKCALGDISSHILGLMEEGRFGKNRIILNFFSSDGATRGGNPLGRQDSEKTVTIFVHTLLHQLISSEAVSGNTQISTASNFFCHLLDTIDTPELFDRFQNIITDDPLAIVKEVLETTDMELCNALVKILERKGCLGIIVNMLGNMVGQEDFLTAVATFVECLSKRSPAIKVLLTCGLVDGTRKTLGGLQCINIQYDKERKGFDFKIPNLWVSNVANKCRVP